MVKKVASFMLGFIVCPSILFLAVIFFFSIPGNIYLWVIGMLVAPLVFFLFPLVVMVKHWKRNKPFFWGLAAGFILEIAILIAGCLVAVQISSVLHHMK
jgi:O-antigen/teichoic acid export membrane protein